MQLTTGNIWTLVPVFRTYAYGHTELDFHLRYDSIRKDTDSVVGYGWTHSYNRWIEEVQYGGKTYGVYHDAAGRRHAFQIDAVGNCIPPIGRGFGLIRVPDGASYYYELVRPNGVVETFDGPGWKLSEIRDRRGRTTYFTYTNGKLTEIRSAHNRVATLTYDANNRVYEIFQPDGEKTVLTYTNGNLTDIKDPRQKSTTYQYDGSRRVTRETLRNGKYYTVEYGSGYRTIKDSLGVVMHELIYGTDGANGIPDTPSSYMSARTLLHRVPQGEAGHTEIWEVQRDNLGRLIKIIAPEYRVLTLRYGGPNDGVAERNRLIAQTDARGNTRKFDWDAKGNLIKLTDEADNDTNYEYLDANVSGLRTKKIESDQDAWEYHHAQENSSTSLIGDLIEIVDPLVETPTDARVTFAYETWPDDAGSPPVPLPGRLHRLTRWDRNGNQSIWEYDPSGNLATFTRVAGDPTTGADLVTTYECDAMGRLTRRTVDRGAGYTPRFVVTAWQWDENGRLESITDDPTPGLNLVHSATYDDHGNLEVLTNPRGIQTRFFYDHRNRRWKAHQADNGASPRETQIVYGEDDNIRRIRDARGNWTDFTYDQQDHLTQVTDAEGYVTFFTPDENGNVLTVQRGLTVGPSPTSLYHVDFEYDALNRTTQRIVDEGASPHLNLVTQYEYATTGGGCGCGGTPGKQLLHSVIDPAGKYTYLHYDKLDRLTKVVRKVGEGDTDPEPNSDDAVISYEYDPAGNLLAVTGAEGELTEYNYDAANRLWKIRNIDTVELPNVVLETILDRDGADNVTGMAVPGGNNYYLSYDAAERLTKVEDDGLGSLKTLVQFGRDQNGNVTSRNTAVTNQTWTYEFNDFDEPWREYDPIVESGSDRYTEFAYDANGNLVQITDRSLVVTKREYDKLNRLTKVIEDFGGTDPTTANTNTYIEYNGAVQTKLKDHDLNTTEYQYDAALRVWRIIYPDDGGTGEGTVTLGYYPSGKLWTRTTQDGVVTTYTYNDLHQLAGRSYSTPSQPAETFAFDRSGRLVAADKTGVAEVDFVFDKIGRLRTETLRYLPSNDAYTTKYDYTVTGNGATRTITYPGGPTGAASGRVVVETYDRRLRQIDVNGGTGVGTTWGYDDADRRDSYQRANGVAGQIDFDLNNRITQILADDTTGTPAALVQLSHGYDPYGNRLWTDNLLKPDRSEIYQYDARNRLTNFRRGTIQWNAGVPSVPNPLAHAQIPGAQTWSLDRRGNWLEFTEQVGNPLVTTTQNRAVANGANEYAQFTIDGVPGDSPDHDAKGNVLRDPYAPNYDPDGPGGIDVSLGQQYVYDAENRLTQVTTDDVTPQPLLGIEYDALGRRIESTDHTGASNPCEGGTQPVTTRQVYAGIQTIEEYVWCDAVPAAWELAREFVWGPRFPEPVAMIDHTEVGDIANTATPEVLHYVQDVLGSTIALTDSSGAAVERYTYDPYGKTVVEDGIQSVSRDRSHYGNPLRWTGQRYHDGVALYHFHFRIFSPSLGRWLNRDPLEYVDGPNLYEYVSSGPVTSIDRFGLKQKSRRHTWIDDIIDEKVIPDGKPASGSAWDGADNAEDVVDNIPPILRDPVGTIQDEFASYYHLFVSDGLSPDEAVVQAAMAMLEDWLFDGNALLDAAEGTDFLGNPLSLGERIGRGLTFAMEMALLVYCVPDDTLVQTPDGFIEIGLLAVGDRVTTSDGVLDDATSTDDDADMWKWTSSHVAEDQADLIYIEPVSAFQRAMAVSRRAGRAKDVDGGSEATTAVDPPSWRLVTLTMTSWATPDRRIDIQCLRPLEWVEFVDARPGRTILFELEEMGIAGPALVESVEPCPLVEPRVGRVVLAKVCQTASELMEIGLAGMDEPLRSTPGHRFYVLERAGWARADELCEGDHLRTQSGLVRIISIDRRFGPQRVVNLEVETEHCYYVTELSVLSHNVIACNRARGLRNQADWAAWLSSMGLRVVNNPKGV